MSGLVEFYPILLLLGTPSALGPYLEYRMREHSLLLRMLLDIFDITLIRTNICLFNFYDLLTVGPRSLYGVLFMFFKCVSV